MRFEHSETKVSTSRNARGGGAGGPQENEFWLFSNIKMNVTVRAEKVDKKWGNLSSFRASFLGYGP